MVRISLEKLEKFSKIYFFLILTLQNFTEEKKKWNFYRGFAVDFPHQNEDRTDLRQTVLPYRFPMTLFKNAFADNAIKLNKNLVQSDLTTMFK